MNLFRKFMQGRYGGDQLSLFLLILSLILSVVFSYFVQIPYVGYLAYIPLALAILRILSKNRTKRYRENYLFINLFSPLKRSINKTKRQMNDKENRYFKCTGCKTTLRVPKGKGKITITCPKCKSKITKKT